MRVKRCAYVCGLYIKRTVALLFYCPTVIDEGKKHSIFHRETQSDELMEDGIIKCDVAFGVDLADQVFSFKESPSHQSDSGCSDMSEDRSVSPASNTGFMSPVDGNLFDFDSVKSDELDEFSEELESYLATPLRNIVPHSNLHTPEMPVVEEMPSLPVGSPEISVDDDDDEDPDYLPSTTSSSRVIQSKARIAKPVVDIKPKASVIKVPASSTSKIQKADLQILPGVKSTVLGTPAIKIVKVVKTAAKQKQDIDNVIFEALDERNKKNAVQAKVNREKKKAYVKSLEEEIDTLKSENVELKENASKSEQEKKELTEEVAYLKSVLANQSAISGLLKNIGNVQNVKLTSSANRKRGAGQDHDYGAVKRSRTSTSKTAGVCLHVDQGIVSLEFCSKCASMAKCTEQDENV